LVTTASKFFFAGAFAALVAAVAYGIGTGGDLLGVVTAGLMGPVGDVAGYTILVAVGLVLGALGTTSSILRDADPEVQAAVARLESLPPVVAPTAASYWPVLGALGGVVAAVGLVASPVLFVIGLMGVGLVLIEWMVSAWSERATGDPSVNRQIRNRMMYPVEIPVLGALGILLLVVSISRILLTVNRISSSVVAVVIATLIMTVAFVVAYRPKLGKDAIAAVLVLFAVVVIAGGVIGAASGTREFEHHEAEHEAPEGDGGAVPADDEPGGAGAQGTDTESPQTAGNDDEPNAEGTDEGTQQGDDESGLAPVGSASEG
jgi:hypothetical protein